MRILFVSTVYPYPVDDGKKVILGSMLDFFIEKFGSESIDYLLVDSGNSNKICKDAKLKNIYSVMKPSATEQLKNVIWYSVIKREKSFQESFLFSKQIKKKIIQLKKENSYDLCIYDTIRMGQYLEGISTEKDILYMDDLFSVRYSEMLEVMKKHNNINFNPLGNFSALLPKWLLPLAHLKFINTLLLKLEKELVFKSEIKISSFFSRVTLISEKEMGLLKSLTSAKEINTVKPIVHFNEYNRNYSGKNKDFLFLGNLNIPHNDVSLREFITLNIDKLIEKNIRIKIIGKNPNSDLKALVNMYPDNLVLMGYVKDLNYEFNTCCGMIIPLIFGSGVKIKTLEALGRGLPIISTDFGVEGIPNMEKNSAIIENDLASFHMHMERLTDIRENNLFSLGSYKYFNKYFLKQAIYHEYERIFRLN